MEPRDILYLLVNEAFSYYLLMDAGEVETLSALIAASKSERDKSRILLLIDDAKELVERVKERKQGRNIAEYAKSESPDRGGSQRIKKL